MYKRVKLDTRSTMLVILTEVRVCQGFRRKHVDRGVNSHLLDESKNKFNK